MRCEYCGDKSNDTNNFIKISYKGYLSNYNSPIVMGFNGDVNKEFIICRYTWCQSNFFGRVTEGDGEFPAKVNIEMVAKFKRDKEKIEKENKLAEEKYMKEWRERAREMKREKVDEEELEREKVRLRKFRENKKAKKGMLLNEK